MKFNKQVFGKPMQIIKFYIGLLKYLLTRAMWKTIIYTNLCKINKNADVCIKGGDFVEDTD